MAFLWQKWLYGFYRARGPFLGKMLFLRYYRIPEGNMCMSKECVGNFHSKTNQSWPYISSPRKRICKIRRPGTYFTKRQLQSDNCYNCQHKLSILIREYRKETTKKEILCHKLSKLWHTSIWQAKQCHNFDNLWHTLSIFVVSSL